ncbi:hypothetical protein ACQ4PT_056743 [Festuca glaucescens]
MCTPCQRCKLWDEHLYKNLDDEKKYFLVLMMGDFQDGMIIPEELVWRLKGKIPRKIKLHTRNDQSHIIAVAKNQEKLVLTVGWSQFVESYDLQMGDSLIFNCNGDSQFNVILFDKLGREKALSAVVDPFMPQVQDRRSDTHETGSDKNMDAPCERCKSWLEYHYMNLDDEKKNFLMLMIGDFQHEMIMPEEFVQRFKGEIPGEIKLETQNRCSYIIEVVRNQEKLVLTAGWGKFAETFGLKIGDTIIFRYNGNSEFSVIIFDKLGYEKALSAVVDPFLPPVQERHTSATETVKSSDFQPQPTEMQPLTTVNRLPMESPRTERQRRLRKYKSCQNNWTTMYSYSSQASEDSFSSEDGHRLEDLPGSNYTVRKKKMRLSSIQKEHLKDGYITTHKTKLTSDQMEEVKRKIHSIHSEILIFVAVMGKSNLDSKCFLTFPSNYAEKYLPEATQLYLQLLGKEWEVSVTDNSACNEKKLGSGWQQFVKDNNLKMGDICLFELLNNASRCTMEVYIIRVNDGN